MVKVSGINLILCEIGVVFGIVVLMVVFIGVGG